MTFTRHLQAAIALLLAMAAPGTATAQSAETGATLFVQYCATCHGREATGQGPMAAVLLVQPTDLTRLSAGNGGIFPAERVVKRIDGRDPLVSHGSPMPVYGAFFEGQDASMKAPSGQPILTSQPIIDLIAYLESLQSQ